VAAFTALSITGVASASPLSIPSLPGATASSNYNTPSFLPSEAIDGIYSNSSQWVGALGGLGANPYLLINLGQPYMLDSVTIWGIGNSGSVTSFNLFVGVNPLTPSPTGTPALTVTNLQSNGTLWSETASFTPQLVQYIEYVSTGTPGGIVNVPDVGSRTQDDPYVVEVTADQVAGQAPEPATIGLMGLGLFGLGVIRRRCS
jgi:hypothetical protein